MIRIFKSDLVKMVNEAVDETFRKMILNESFQSSTISNFFKQHGGLKKDSDFGYEGIGDITDDMIYPKYTQIYTEEQAERENNSDDIRGRGIRHFMANDGKVLRIRLNKNAIQAEIPMDDMTKYNSSKTRNRAAIKNYYDNKSDYRWQHARHPKWMTGRFDLPWKGVEVESEDAGWADDYYIRHSDHYKDAVAKSNAEKKLKKFANEFVSMINSRFKNLLRLKADTFINHQPGFSAILIDVIKKKDIPEIDNVIDNLKEIIESKGFTARWVSCNCIQVLMKVEIKSFFGEDNIYF